ncbi:MAG: copper homeostasis protein CutC [Flavisolibacter sp.]
MDPSYIIEIATADLATTTAAVEGGADRIELCAALTEGGTTPSHGMIKTCRSLFEVELFPIIRPRGGDFLYSDEEFEVMKQDILFCKELLCDGVVSGLLLPDGRIDLERTKILIGLAWPMEFTFHRAYDRCKDPHEALEQLAQAGCTRILTSGQQPTAPGGQQLIAELVKQAAGNIVIMPGSGVRKENIRELAEKTGAVEFHSSLRGKTESRMTFRHPAFSSEESYTNPYINPGEVKALRKALS